MSVREICLYFSGFEPAISCLKWDIFEAIQNLLGRPSQTLYHHNIQPWVCLKRHVHSSNRSLLIHSAQFVKLLAKIISILFSLLIHLSRSLSPTPNVLLPDLSTNICLLSLIFITYGRVYRDHSSPEIDLTKGVCHRSDIKAMGSCVEYGMDRKSTRLNSSHAD